MSLVKADPALRRHVDDIWKGEENDPILFLAADAVSALVGSPGFEAVMSVLREEVGSIDRKLDRNPLENAAQYAQAHGRRGALLAFEEAAQAIIEVAGQRMSEAQSKIEAAGESAAER